MMIVCCGRTTHEAFRHLSPTFASRRARIGRPAVNATRSAATDNRLPNLDRNDHHTLTFERVPEQLGLERSWGSYSSPSRMSLGTSQFCSRPFPLVSIGIARRHVSQILLSRANLLFSRARLLYVRSLVHVSLRTLLCCRTRGGVHRTHWKDLAMLGRRHRADPSADALRRLPILANHRRGTVPRLLRTSFA